MDLTIFENLLQWSGQNLSDSESENAKIEFFKQFGKVFPEDNYFDSRMQYFDCVRVFEIPYKSHKNLTPFEAWRLEKSNSPLLSYLHSCFVVQKISERGLEIKDIWTAEVLEIKSLKNQNLQLFQSGDLIQCFLLYIEDDIFLAPGTMQHPREIVKLVLKKAKIISHKSEIAKHDFLQKLSHINLKHLRQKNLAPKQVYDMGLNFITS